MAREANSNRIMFFTVPVAVLIVVASGTGLLLDDLYSRETAMWTAQAIGQDMVNLAVIVPAMLVSAICAVRGMPAAVFAWFGTMLYTIYTYVIYCFAVHFNQLFLVYCAVLGLSLYAVVTVIAAADPLECTRRLTGLLPARVASVLLFALAAAFLVLWLSEIIPAGMNNAEPRSVADTGLLTNPVHVLDLSTVLPGFIVASILLWKKRPLGYLLVPALLVFATLMDITIGSLIVIMKARGVVADSPPAMMFVLLGTVTLTVFVGFVRPLLSMKKYGVLDSNLLTDTKGN